MRDTPRHDPSTLGAVTDDPSSQYPAQPPYGPPQYGPPQYGPPAPPRKKGLPAIAVVGIALGGALALCIGAGAIVTAVSGDKPTSTAPTAVVTTGAAANGSTPTAAGTTAPAVKTAQLGQTLVFKGAFGSSEIHYTLTADKTYTTSPQYDVKPSKGVYFAVSATVEAKKGSAYATIADFAVIAADGTVYESTIGFGFDKAMPPGTQLNAGQRTAGLVVFDLPQAALKGAKIELRADFFSSGDAGYWQLP